MNELEIHKYKIKGKKFEHHLPESLVEDFKAEVKKAGKRWQFIGDYKISSDRHQESCDNSAIEVIEDKIFHPPDELLIETIQEINIQVCEVFQPNKDNSIFHCPLDDRIANLANHIKFNDAQSKEVERYPITIREYRDKCKNRQANENFIDIDDNLEINDPLASEFAQINKEDIKTIEDITMTTATETKVQDKTSASKSSLPELANAEKENLMEYLGSCTRAFLDELILTFNDEEALKLYQYAHSTKKKQNVMYQIVTKDLEKSSSQFEAIKEFHDYVQGSAESVNEAKETMKSYRAGLQGKVNDIGTKFVIKEQTKERQKEILGQVKCNKDIEEGLKGIGKAIVAGHIIGKKDQVVAAANHISEEVSSKIIKYQDLSDKSLEGVKKVTRNTNKSINKLVQTLLDKEGNLNAKANGLVVEQPNPATNNVNEPVPQPTNS